MATVQAVVILDTTIEERTCDASHMSPYVSDIIGQSVTFVGAWGPVSMLGPLVPDPRRPLISPDRLPAGCDSGLRAPLVVTRLNEEFVPVDFTVKDYEELVRSSAADESAANVQ